MLTSDIRAEQLPEIALDWFKQFQLLQHYLDALSHVDIASLGPTGTSSEVAVSHFISSFCKNKEAHYSLFPSYEHALDSLREGAHNLLIIANAYDKVDRFYMSTEITLLYSFIFSTPEYGVAKSPLHEVPVARRARIATHHAPSSLIPWFLSGLNIDEYEILTVGSTSQAAICAQRGEADLCVTNLPAASLYGLDIISRTRPIRMLWSVFGA